MKPWILVATVAVAACVVAYFALWGHGGGALKTYDLKGKKVVVVVFQGFQPREFYPVRDYLSKCGAHVAVLAVHKSVGISYDMYIYDVKDRFDEIASSYDAIVLIGGPGVYTRVVSGGHPEVQLLEQLVVKFRERGKLVAAICAAPAVLAKAGVLKGVKATCYPDKALISILEEHGAVYTGDEVTVSDGIITANGPGAAYRFAQAVAEALAGG